MSKIVPTQIAIARATVLRLQLDEETGVRGFDATVDPLFLEPYKKARMAMPSALAALREKLAPLAIDGILAVVNDEEHRNAFWDSSVAAHLVADPSRSAQTRELQRRGKQIVDDFRNDDQQLVKLLDDAASAADSRSQEAIASTLLFGLAALTLIVAGAGFFGFLQARASRRAFESRLLYENQKRIADSLQTAFLTKELPASSSVGLHATYVPAALEAQVGGDWYDAFELPDSRILFSIGDVAGHGIEAAVVMSRARQAIIAAALHENDPAKVLERANTSIVLQETRMVTAICGYIDPRTLEVVYATAGHPAPVLARPGLPSELLPHDGVPLGIVPDATYRTFVARPLEGAVLVFYTDGVIEHKRNIIEGMDALLEASRLAVLEENPALAIQRLVFKTAIPTDDVAILTVKFKETAKGGKGTTVVAGLQVSRTEVPSPGAASQPDQSSQERVFDPREDRELDVMLRELLRSRC